MIGRLDMPAPAMSTAPTAARTAQRGALLGDAVVVIWNDVAEEGLEQFYAWHDHEHIPERLGIPRFARGRRYTTSGHAPRWLTLYEALDLVVLVSPQYLARLNAPTPPTRATLPFFRNTSRATVRPDAAVNSLEICRLHGAANTA